MPQVVWNTRIFALAAAVCLPAMAWGHANAPPSPSAHATSQPTKGRGPDASKMTAGIIYGQNWLILCRHLPPGWNCDTDLANHFGVQEIFHPQDWNSRSMSPSVVVAISRKDPGVTIASEVVRDGKNMRKNFPECKITSAPPLDASNRQGAPVRIFAYKIGWDKVVYSDGGKVIFLTTLHCGKAAECASFEPTFAMFVDSLVYQGNIKVIDKTKPQ